MSSIVLARVSIGVLRAFIVTVANRVPSEVVGHIAAHVLRLPGLLADALVHHVDVRLAEPLLVIVLSNEVCQVHSGLTVGTSGILTAPAPQTGARQGHTVKLVLPLLAAVVGLPHD